MRFIHFDYYLDRARCILDVALEHDQLYLALLNLPPYDLDPPHTPSCSGYLFLIIALHEKFRADPSSALDQKVFNEIMQNIRYSGVNHLGIRTLELLIQEMDYEKSDEAAFHIDHNAVLDACAESIKNSPKLYQNYLTRNIPWLEYPSAWDALPSYDAYFKKTCGRGFL